MYIVKITSQETLSTRLSTAINAETQSRLYIGALRHVGAHSCQSCMPRREGRCGAIPAAWISFAVSSPSKQQIEDSGIRVSLATPAVFGCSCWVQA